MALDKANSAILQGHIPHFFSPIAAASELRPFVVSGPWAAPAPGRHYRTSARQWHSPDAFGSQETNTFYQIAVSEMQYTPQKKVRFMEKMNFVLHIYIYTYIYIRFRGTYHSFRQTQTALKGARKPDNKKWQLTFETTRKVRLALRRFNFIGIKK